MASVSSVRQPVRNPSATSLRAPSTLQSQPSLRFDVQNTVKEEQPPGTLEMLSSVLEFSSTMDRARPVPVPSVVLPADSMAAQEVATVLEYEEVPPWNQPRSVDDIHFLWSHRCDTMICRMFRVLLLLVPIGLITLGALNKGKCPKAPLLPYWAISTGIIWIVHCGCYFLFRKSTEKNTKGYRFIKGIFVYSAAVAFVLGTVLTYGSLITYNMTDKVSQNYCDPYILFASTVLVSIGYFILAVLLYFYVFTFHFSSYEPEIL